MSALPSDHSARVARTQLALEGLSLGDARHCEHGGRERAVDLLGNGSEVTAQDTGAARDSWCIARQPRDFVEALWTTVSALGDRDTTCAMVGDAVALTERGGTIPAAWLRARESLSRFAKLGVAD